MSIKGVLTTAAIAFSVAVPFKADASQVSFQITAIVGGECSAHVEYVERIGQHLKVNFSRACHRPHSIRVHNIRPSSAPARVMYAGKAHELTNSISLQSSPILEETMESLYILGAAKAGIAEENLSLWIEPF